MYPRDFIRRVHGEVVAYFEKEGRPLHHRCRGHLAQFWWGDDPAVHYEIWVHERSLKLELGLHFEGRPESNQALLRAFGRHLLEVHIALGDTMWAEDWDKGWTRIYETVPLMPLDEGRVYWSAARLCEIIECLQPLLERLEESAARQ